MGLVLEATGAGKDKALKTLEKLAGFTADRYQDVLQDEPFISSDGDDPPALTLKFAGPHDDLQIAVSGKRKVRATAQWNQLGPGYCVYVADKLREMGDATGVAWKSVDAEIGVPGWPTYEAACKAALAWLGALCGLANDPEVINSDGERSPLGLSLPFMPLPLINADALTCVGPWSFERMREIARQPELGKRFFAWWDQGRGARVLRGLAVTRMWIDVAWIPALSNEEFVHHWETADLLQQAFDADPAIEYPWAEWAQILDLLDAMRDRVKELGDWPTRHAGVVRQRAQGLKPRIGYRRWKTRCALPAGWSIDVPGSYAKEFEIDEEAQTLNWSAFDDQNTLRVTPHLVPEGLPQAKRELAEELTRAVNLLEPKGAKPVDWEEHELVGLGAIRPVVEDGREYQELTGVSAADGGAWALFSFSFDDPATRDRAIETWKTLRYAPPED
ncbi:MAG: hypothetical protein RIB58_08575 [Phycisphaerales bacterium]